MAGLAILLLFHLLGLVVHDVGHVPLPANVLGLILLTLALLTGVVKMAWVETAADFLLQHMLLFFVPYVVGTAVFWPEISHNALPIAAALTVGTLVTMIATSATAQGLMRKETR